ncbi:MAG: ABC transporter substrate binding protein [Rickettsiaceae bacterium]
MLNFITTYRILLLITSLFFTSNIYASSLIESNRDQTDATLHKTIAIIVPLEHEAMFQIVSGIKDTLIDMDVELQVKNAHSDPNIMLALVKQIKEQNVDLIMPIGTSACQMTVSHIKTKPIICVAALPDEKQNPLVTGVNDEIPISASISKIPKLQNIAVIYSASEKIVPEIEALKVYALKNKISLNLFMIQTLIDLPVVVKNIPKDTQAFLILKDHLIVSGINILLQEAKKRSIPLIASDEGSVKNGASLAIGVREKDIGIESALMAKRILQGVSPKDIPYKTLDDKFVLFINEDSFATQKLLDINDINKLKMTIIRYFQH